VRAASFAQISSEAAYAPRLLPPYTNSWAFPGINGPAASYMSGTVSELRRFLLTVPLLEPKVLNLRVLPQSWS
jgi:hypothetical protein